MKSLGILRAATFACVTVTALSAQEAFLRTNVEVQSLQSATLSAQVSGMPGYQAVFLAGRHVPTGVPTPFGTLYLDPATMFVAGTATMNDNGVGEMSLPFAPAAYANLQVGFQAVTLSPQGNLALSNDDLVFVKTGAGLSWGIAGSLDPQGCIKVQMAGQAGTTIEILHTDGTRAGTTRMWSATIPNPPRSVKTPGRIYPPSWARGESIVIKVNGAEQLRFTKR